MTKPNQLMDSRISKTGISLTEYSVLIGLIGVLSIFGLKSLGESLQSLFSGTSTHLESNNTLSVLAPINTESPQRVKLTLQGKNYYSLVIDPATGKPVLQLTSGTNGVSVNTTSTDGNFNTVGSIMLANSLDKLAENETDPEKKAYYKELADLSFYLGGAEGEMDGVPNLDIADSDGRGTYTRGDALRDIYTYQKKLKDLMNNPPDSMNKTELLSVLPFAADAYNISQTYLNTFSKFIKSDGSVPGNFGVASRCDGPTCPLGNGTPGSALANVNKATFLPQANKMLNKSYDQLRSRDQIRDVATTVLTDNKVESVQVENTLTDATVIDTQAATSSKSP